MRREDYSPLKQSTNHPSTYQSEIVLFILFISFFNSLLFWSSISFRCKVSSIEVTGRNVWKREFVWKVEIGGRKFYVHARNSSRGKFHVFRFGCFGNGGKKKSGMIFRNPKTDRQRESLSENSARTDEKEKRRVVVVVPGQSGAAVDSE